MEKEPIYLLERPEVCQIRYLQIKIPKGVCNGCVILKHFTLDVSSSLPPVHGTFSNMEWEHSNVLSHIKIRPNHRVSQRLSVLNRKSLSDYPR